MQRNTIIEDCENRLTKAMLFSNIEELDTLLSDDLIFTDHTGALLSKKDDINAHKSGFISIKSINCSDQKISFYKATAIVSVIMDISGTFGGNQAIGKFRFTRTWHQIEQAKWQLIAAHSTLISQKV
ncbi:MAG: nuclear transport factor 2 family protein [Pseudomonadota bacterium]